MSIRQPARRLCAECGGVECAEPQAPGYLVVCNGCGKTERMVLVNSTAPQYAHPRGWFLLRKAGPVLEDGADTLDFCSLACVQHWRLGMEQPHFIPCRDTVTSAPL